MCRPTCSSLHSARTTSVWPSYRHGIEESDSSNHSQLGIMQRNKKSRRTKIKKTRHMNCLRMNEKTEIRTMIHIKTKVMTTKKNNKNKKKIIMILIDNYEYLLWNVMHVYILTLFPEEFVFKPLILQHGWWNVWVFYDNSPCGPSYIFLS